MTHLRALQKSQGGGEPSFHARLRRLQAVKTSFAVDSKDAGFVSKGRQLYCHGMARTMLELIMTVLHEVMVLSAADRQQLGAKTMAGAHTSFIACISHMLPGEEAAAVHVMTVLQQWPCPALSSRHMKFKEESHTTAPCLKLVLSSSRILAIQKRASIATSSQHQSIRLMLQSCHTLHSRAYIMTLIRLPSLTDYGRAHLQGAVD